ncbi:membrane protein [Salmonella enterica subsp. enterica]|uniref:Membrane protein n=1 Tax=Salmonella enterica I TaxID=59201 RepID=A0A447U6Y2_SALET|nr:membrane protein [Salmonella enterica subsp. enterica]
MMMQKNWDADELMDNLRKGTKEANKDRIAKGIEPIEIIGWIEKPTYDATNHRLIWSAAIQDIGTNEPLNEQGVNYNTYLPGT